MEISAALFGKKKRGFLPEFSWDFPFGMLRGYLVEYPGKILEDLRISPKGSPWGFHSEFFFPRLLQEFLAPEGSPELLQEFLTGFFPELYPELLELSWNLLPFFYFGQPIFLQEFFIEFPK